MAEKLIPIEISNQFIFPSAALKILGVSFDKNMKLEGFVSGIIAKCTGPIMFLYRNAGFLPRKTKLLLYNALVTPHLNYCDVVWANAISVSLKKHLESIQNAGMRFILNDIFRSSFEAMRKDLGWITLENKRKLHYFKASD